MDGEAAALVRRRGVQTGRESTTVLLIDDEPHIVSFVSRALRSHGFQVECAQDGRRGLELARTGAFGVVVLDLLMPRVDGIATLRGIMASRPEQPVLVLSALSDVEAKVRCLELGAADYLAKPFALAELLARVRAQVRHARGAGDERFLHVGGVTVDRQRRAASTGSTWVGLSNREFELLVHLMRRAGTPCPREELLADVWDCPHDPGTNVVDVYIRRLRSKLGDDMIETVRNVGYSLNAA